MGIRDGGDPFGFDSRLAWKPNNFSNCDTTLDSNENFDDECDVLETNCEASCAVDTVDEDFYEYDANVLSSISNGNFNDYTFFLEKA